MVRNPLYETPIFVHARTLDADEYMENVSGQDTPGTKGYLRALSVVRPRARVGGLRRIGIGDQQVPVIVDLMIC